MLNEHSKKLLRMMDEIESQNSSQPIIINDMDVILGSELEEYKRKNEFPNTTVVDFNSLFDENGDFEGGGGHEMRNGLENGVFVEDDEEVRFEGPSFSDLASSPSSPSGFSSSSSEIGDVLRRDHGGGGNEDVEKPSFLQMALLDEEKIGACTSYVKDSKATLLPRSFPTRPRNCIHHMIPFSLFTEDLEKRFPFSLNAKRKLMAKYGEPDANSNYFMMSPVGLTHYLSLVNVNVEDIPSLNPSEKKKIVTVSKLRSDLKGGNGKGAKKTTTTTKKTRQVSPKVKCQFCDKTYKQKGAMKRHAREKHGVYM